MKAIETEYKGILFRSRLEARWAIFFDAFDLEWVYEPDCFLLSNNQKYTPDFYLPKFDLYIEVKPTLWWQNIKYHANRYEIFEKDLLILSDDFPSFRVNKLYHFVDGVKYENNVVFCPKSKYEPFYFSGEDLGSIENYFDNDFVDELNKVKQYRFYK